MIFPTALLLLTCLLTVGANDDLDVQSLQRTVAKQAAAIATLQADVTSLKAQQTRTRTDVGVLQRKDKTVGFTVHFSGSDQVNQGIAMGAHTILRFDYAVSNIGGGYSPKTGIFSAPVAGLYSFFLTAMAPNGHPALFLALDKGGKVLDFVFAEGGTDNYDQGSTQVTTHLDGGEQVWVRQHSGDAVRGGSWTVFSGHLIQAD